MSWFFDACPVEVEFFSQRKVHKNCDSFAPYRIPPYVLIAALTCVCKFRLLCMAVMHIQEGRRMFHNTSKGVESRENPASELSASELFAHNQLLGAVLANVDAFVYMKAVDGRYLYANDKVIELFGMPIEDVLGHTDAELLSPDVARKIMSLDRKVLSSGLRQAREEVVTDHDGKIRHFWSIKTPFEMPDRRMVVIGSSTEITELLQLRKTLEQQKTTDALTGLPNRFQFETELARSLKTAHQGAGLLAVLLIDLDRFKYLNNTLGQRVGDGILREAARRLRECHWLSGNPARLGGNEFAITLTRVPTESDVATVAERLRLILAEPYEFADKYFHLTASVGISLYEVDGEQALNLIAHAESAMYFAKEKGRNQYQFYSREIGNAVSLRIELERDLRAAITQRRFELYYQPKIFAADMRIAGVEALIRWNRPGHGLMPPAAFIPLAEQLGLIVQLGDWVIEEACRQLTQWSAQGLGAISIAVNLSISQLATPALVGQVAAILQRYCIEDGRLEMEVTESMMMEDPERAIERLRALRELGIRFSIDDFGTGFSSMSYLKRLPVDTLKLDRSFVSQIANDPRDADLCAGVIALAHKLGLKVVAEGVETAEQRDVLLGQDCDIFQGYLFSRPLPLADATAYLQHQRVDSGIKSLLAG